MHGPPEHDRDADGRLLTAEPSYGWGNVTHTWGPTESKGDFLYHVMGSYAINGWCYGPDVDDRAHSPGGERYGVGPRNAWHTFPVKESSNVPIFCDSAPDRADSNSMSSVTGSNDAPAAIGE